MNPRLLFFVSLTSFVIGAVYVAFAIASNRTAELAGPWFFLGLLAAWTGSLFVTQQSRIQELEKELKQLQGKLTETNPTQKS